MKEPSDRLSRRDFVARSGSCAAHLALAAGMMPLAARRAWARTPVGTVVAREPFGNLERVSDGVWTLVSTPLSGDSTTVSNGSIIAGKNAVLAIEGLNKAEGAVWLATKAKELTGRWPTHVVLTHYHSDHANGIAGYLSAGDHPPVRSTARTRDLVIERNTPIDASRNAAVADAIIMSPSEPTTLDLGGKVVRIIPRAGHTESDVSLELDDPSIVVCGDLFWNAMFPNFVDAIPSKLAQSVRALRRSRETTYIPGHGAIGRAPEYDRYIAMLDDVEHGARKAYASGATAADAGAAFTLPPSLGEWTMFSKAFVPRAFDAWYKELKGA
ncbi:MAG TPA: MBL fold metallo-hydrolase [Gemmatimonadaceae bacterium]|jgi:glyoxylase-like metal-dependent hydrolase (beta-lactamase superfamily II)|nr:MBL fold metallo-hydrolase [Gemmatimonadaceae bacterium]